MKKEVEKPELSVSTVAMRQILFSDKYCRFSPYVFIHFIQWFIICPVHAYFAHYGCFSIPNKTYGYIIIYIVVLNFFLIFFFSNICYFDS